MYNNLLAEMTRQKISKYDIAKRLNVSEKTARNYLNGKTKISWQDSLKIRNTYFPNLDMEYLFYDESINESIN